MDDRLFAYGLGTFHTLLFFVPLLLVLHLRGALEGLLVLGTLAGVVVFLVFWAVTCVATAFALRGVRRGRHPFGQAALWGAVEGVAFVVVFAVAAALLTGPAVLVVIVTGGVFAAPIGALVGVLFGAVDLLLVRSPPSRIGGS